MSRRVTAGRVPAVTTENAVRTYSGTLLDPTWKAPPKIQNATGSSLVLPFLLPLGPGMAGVKTLSVKQSSDATLESGIPKTEAV